MTPKRKPPSPLLISLGQRSLSVSRSLKRGLSVQPPPESEADLTARTAASVFNPAWRTRPTDIAEVIAQYKAVMRCSRLDVVVLPFATVYGVLDTPQTQW